MALLPWLIRTHFLVPTKFFRYVAQENKYSRKFSYIIMKLYVVHLLESPHRGDSF